MKNALVICAIAASTMFTACKKDEKKDETTNTPVSETSFSGFVGNDTVVYVANADASVSSYSYSGAAAQLNKTVKVTIKDGKIASMTASSDSFKMKVHADVQPGNTQSYIQVNGKTIAMTGTKGTSDIIGDRDVTITATANGKTLLGNDTYDHTELVISKVE